MSLAGDLMEIPEAAVTAHYPAATAMLERLEHSPRIAAPREAPAAERSPRGRLGAAVPLDHAGARHAQPPPAPARSG